MYCVRSDEYVFLRHDEQLLTSSQVYVTVSFRRIN